MATLKNHSLFIPYRGPKLCGGFHPDYCLEFKDKEKTLYLQICFGCHELKMIQDGKIQMCDMAQGTGELLNKKIGLYRKNRPEKSSEH